LHIQAALGKEEVDSSNLFNSSTIYDTVRWVKCPFSGVFLYFDAFYKPNGLSYGVMVLWAETRVSGVLNGFRCVTYRVTCGAVKSIEPRGCNQRHFLVNMGVNPCSQIYAAVSHQLACGDQRDAGFGKVGAVCMPQVIWRKRFPMRG